MDAITFSRLGELKVATFLNFKTTQETTSYDDSPFIISLRSSRNEKIEDVFQTKLATWAKVTSPPLAIRLKSIANGAADTLARVEYILQWHINIFKVYHKGVEAG